MQETVTYRIYKYKYKDHKKYKKPLLEYFKSEPVSRRNVKKDSIYKFDFDRSTDLNRNWVKMILQSFVSSFEKFLIDMKFKTIDLKDLWFQQYKKGNTHQRHIHGCTFTGVYYVKYDKNCVGTELVNPINNKIIRPKVSEGDIIVFPSFIIHTAPPQISNTLKTIISFNFDCDL